MNGEIEFFETAVELIFSNGAVNKNNFDNVNNYDLWFEIKTFNYKGGNKNDFQSKSLILLSILVNSIVSIIFMTAS